MQVSPTSSASAAQQASVVRAPVVVKPQPQVSAPTDSDGDHDGSTAASGRLNIKA